MIDSRIRVLALFLISIAHGVASLNNVPLLIIITVISIAFYFKFFLRGLWAISITIVSFIGLAIFVLILTPQPSYRVIILEYSRWASLATFSVIMFYSLNVFDLVSSLVFLRVPIRIALSLGIGLRFLPVLYEETKRVVYVQRHRGIYISYQNIRRYGFFGLLNRALSPHIVSALRRIDSLSVSIRIQQLEQRIQKHKFIEFKVVDWITLLFVLLVFLFVSVT